MQKILLLAFFTLVAAHLLNAQEVCDTLTMGVNADFATINTEKVAITFTNVKSIPIQVEGYVEYIGDISKEYKCRSEAAYSTKLYFNDINIAPNSTYRKEFYWNIDCFSAYRNYRVVITKRRTCWSKSVELPYMLQTATNQPSTNRTQPKKIVKTPQL